MNKTQAIQILEQALNVASSKGVFNLQDSATILAALTIIKKELEGVLTETEKEVK